MTVFVCRCIITSINAKFNVDEKGDGHNNEKGLLSLVRINYRAAAYICFKLNKVCKESFMNGYIKL